MHKKGEKKWPIWNASVWGERFMNLAHKRDSQIQVSCLEEWCMQQCFHQTPDTIYEWDPTCYELVSAMWIPVHTASTCYDLSDMMSQCRILIFIWQGQTKGHLSWSKKMMKEKKLLILRENEKAGCCPIAGSAAGKFTCQMWLRMARTERSLQRKDQVTGKNHTPKDGASHCNGISQGKRASLC